mmetsp:Transcript_24190/g.38358  ORF Transcript_24190/g.38358 Transcript_24190/m.38358 type:complete len:381 (+) Transcript_24190:42-1184(+)
MAEQQLKVRNISIKNNSTSTIYVHVGYQQSVITQANCVEFSRFAASQEKGRGYGGGVNVGIAGLPFDVGVNARYDKRNESALENEEMKHSQYDIKVAPFRETEGGWISILSTDDRNCAVRGEIAWFDVWNSDGSEIIRNWHSTATRFLYNGSKFDEIRREEYQFRIASDEKEQHAPKMDEEASSRVIDIEVYSGEPNEYQNIASISYPGCNEPDAFLVHYFIIGFGIFTLCITFVLCIARAVVYAVVICWEWHSLWKKSWILVKCEAMPTRYKYRYNYSHSLREGEKKKNNAAEGQAKDEWACPAVEGIFHCAFYKDVWWILLSLFIGFIHFCIAICFMFTIIFYPLAVVHWNLAMISLFAPRCDIVEIGQNEYEQAAPH